MRRLGFLGAALAGVLGLLHAPAASAQTAAGEGLTLFGWSVTGNLEAQVAPDFMGAKTYSVGPGGSLQF